MFRSSFLLVLSLSLFVAFFAPSFASIVVPPSFNVDKCRLPQTNCDLSSLGGRARFPCVSCKCQSGVAPISTDDDLIRFFNGSIPNQCGNVTENVNAPAGKLSNRKPGFCLTISAVISGDLHLGTHGCIRIRGGEVTGSINASGVESISLDGENGAIGGNIHGGKEGDSVHLKNIQVAGFVNLSSGDDVLRLEQGSTVEMKVDLSKGNDVAIIDQSTVGGGKSNEIVLTGGLGDDKIYAEQATINGAISGDGMLTTTSLATDGGGNDIVNFVDTDFGTIRTERGTDCVQVQQGSDGNSVLVGPGQGSAIVILDSMLRGDVGVVGVGSGKGNLRIIINDSTVDGSIETSQGADVVCLANGNVGGSISTGSNDDFLYLPTTTVGGNIDAGTGSDICYTTTNEPMNCEKKFVYNLPTMSPTATPTEAPTPAPTPFVCAPGIQQNVENFNRCIMPGLLGSNAGSVTAKCGLFSCGGLCNLTCSGDTVTAFGISGFTFKGSIPTEIATFSGLTSAVIGASSVTGTLPPQLFTLTNLKTLILTSNKIQGFPASIPSLVGSKLENLVLSGDPYGTIPVQFRDLTNLKTFAMNGAGITSATAPFFSVNLDLCTVIGNPFTCSCCANVFLVGRINCDTSACRST